MNWFKSFWKRLTTPVPQAGPTPAEAFHNFSPRAQRVLALAREEALLFNHNFIGTEHVLLGIISLGQGTAVAVLRKLGINQETVRAEVEKFVGRGPEQRAASKMPYTPRAKKVLALAITESRQLHHDYTGTEHILLGLLREGNGVAARVLKTLGMDLESTRQNVLRELDPNFVPATDAEATRGVTDSKESKPSQPKPDAAEINRRYKLNAVTPTPKETQQSIYDLLSQIRSGLGCYPVESHLGRLASFLAGYQSGIGALGYCLRDHEHFLLFNDWVANRLGFSNATSGWDKMIRERSADDSEAFQKFFTLLDEFRK
jgi:hypothetical protein